MILPDKKRRLVSLLRRRRESRALLRKLPKESVINRSRHASILSSTTKGWYSEVSPGPDDEADGFDTLFEPVVTLTQDQLKLDIHIPVDSPMGGIARLEALLGDPIRWVAASKATTNIGTGLRLISSPAIPAQPAQPSPKTPISPSPRKLTNGTSTVLKPAHVRAKISPKWSFEGLQTTGMSRPSMTCYRRSSLQALLHAPVFLNWILHHDNGDQNDPVAPNPYHHCRSNKPPAGCLACGLKSLAAAYWKRSRDSRLINTSAIAIDKTIHTLGSRPNFKLSTRSIHEQGDPMEFINWILSYFDSFTPPPMPKEQLHTLFRLELNVRRVCQRCGTKEDPGRSQVSFNISMGLAKGRGKPFKRHLHNFFNDEGTPGQCAKCSSKHQMPEELRIRTAPEILFIHIDRNFYGRQKIRDAVDFPNILDLTRYKSGSFNGPEGPLMYSIGAVISHQGGIHGGHYISTTKSPAGVFHANDETIRKAEFTDTKGHPRFPFEPVVLMYLKR